MVSAAASLALPASRLAKKSSTTATLSVVFGVDRARCAPGEHDGDGETAGEAAARRRRASMGRFPGHPGSRVPGASVEVASVSVVRLHPLRSTTRSWRHASRAPDARRRGRVATSDGARTLLGARCDHSRRPGYRGSTSADRGLPRGTGALPRDGQSRGSRAVSTTGPSSVIATGRARCARRTRPVGGAEGPAVGVGGATPSVVFEEPGLDRDDAARLEREPALVRRSGCGALLCRRRLRPPKSVFTE